MDHDTIESDIAELRERLESISTKLDVLAHHLKVAPFAIGDVVYKKDNHWDGITVANYNDTFTKFKNLYGDWKNVSDYDKP